MMRRLILVTCVLLIGASGSHGQSSTPAPAQSGNGGQSAASAKSPDVIGHGAIPVEITQSLDSSKLSQGEAVEAKTSGEFILPDGTKVPRGSKVTGHVTEAKARSKGDPQSELTIVFEAVSLPDQKQQLIKGLIQAVGPRQDDGGGPADPMAATMSKQAAAGTGWAPNMTSGSNTQTLGSPSREILNPQSTGVKGIHNLELGPDGVLTSKGKNVKLDSGDRMIVHVDLLKP